MHLLKLILRNALRHKLRTGLTAFASSWRCWPSACCNGGGRLVRGAQSASNARLVTRNAISLGFSLPVSYENRIRSVRA